MVRLRIGSIPVNENFDPLAGNWTPCKEPKPWVSTWLIAVPLSLLLAVSFAVMLFRLTPIDLQGLTFYKLLLLYTGLVITHEAIHAIMQPDRGTSALTTLGFWPSHLVFYAHYDGERSRANFLFGLVSPFLLLSVVPMLLAIAFQTNAWWVGALILGNAVASSVDLFGFFAVLLGTPKNSQVINNGWYTYWRLRS
ncbi:hypothetical protein CDR19_06175 [Ectopseudomonas toyotomiensis]|uniref:Putative zincin peptidase n=1 Tax=Ectopseudomonas toyotomiensis TaxID=554344 RepID=A0A1I5TSH8_9GAMM|nr:hypothetical protein CDR19_06175 [Pseudomonas toyotomiensis]SFP85871.1 Putative zincin peptidase [Pseudomonas toyotomiensis]